MSRLIDRLYVFLLSLNGRIRNCVMHTAYAYLLPVIYENIKMKRR